MEDWFNPKATKKEHFKSGYMIGIRECLEWLAEEQSFDATDIAWLYEQEFYRKNKESKAEELLDDLVEAEKLLK